MRYPILASFRSEIDQNLELCQPAPWLHFGKNGKVSDQTERT